MLRLTLTEKSLPGDALRYIRETKGLTIRNVHKATGIDCGYLSRIETNHREPITKKDKVKKLANVLEINENLLRRVLLCGSNPIGENLAVEVIEALSLEMNPENVSVAVKKQNITIIIDKVVVVITAPPGTNITVEQ